MIFVGFYLLAGLIIATTIAVKEEVFLNKMTLVDLQLYALVVVGWPIVLYIAYKG